MNRPNTAILDFDGTIAESMYIWDECPGELIRRHGGTPPEDLVRAIAPMVIDEALTWMRDRCMPGAEVPELKRELYDMIAHEYAEVVKPKPGAIEAVRRMRRDGMHLCVLSATDSRMVRSALERFGILGEFEFVAFADEWGGKTHPECFLHAAKRLGSAPCDTIVFEDALHAALTAKRAGFKIAGVYDASSAHEWDELRRIADWSGELLSDWAGEI